MSQEKWARSSLLHAQRVGAEQQERLKRYVESSPFRSTRYSPDEIDPTMLIQQEQSSKLRSSKGKTSKNSNWVDGKQSDTKATSHIDYRILSKQLKATSTVPL